MTTTSDNIAAISKAADAILGKVPQGYGMTRDEALIYAEAALSAYPALLEEARKAEAVKLEIAEKDARIAALEEGVSDLVEIARQGVPSIPPDGPTSPEHQAAYEATGFTLVEIRSLARTLLNGEKS